MNKNYTRGIVAGVLVVLALVSIFVIARFATSVDFHSETIKSLDDKKDTVMDLVATSTAASAAITLIPGDACTPIAEKLADFSTYFLVALAAIYIEKFLLTITGYAAFYIIIPAALLLGAANVFLVKKQLSKLSLKLLLFGILISFIIPVSVGVSNMIEETHEASIQNTIETAKETTEEIEESAEEESKEDQGIFSGIITGITEGISNITAQAERVLNDFIEALAVTLVTSCVIPVLVLIFFVWLIKVFLRVDFDFLNFEPHKFKKRTDGTDS